MICCGMAAAMLQESVTGTRVCQRGIECGSPMFWTTQPWSRIIVKDWQAREGGFTLHLTIRAPRLFGLRAVPDSQIFVPVPASRRPEAGGLSGRTHHARPLAARKRGGIRGEGDTMNERSDVDIPEDRSSAQARRVGLRSSRWGPGGRGGDLLPMAGVEHPGRLRLRLRARLARGRPGPPNAGGNRAGRAGPEPRRRLRGDLHRVPTGLTDEEAVTKAMEEFGRPEDLRPELEATHGHRILAVLIDRAGTMEGEYNASEVAVVVVGIHRGANVRQVSSFGRIDRISQRRRTVSGSTGTRYARLARQCVDQFLLPGPVEYGAEVLAGLVGRAAGFSPSPLTA